MNRLVHTMSKKDFQSIKLLFAIVRVLLLALFGVTYFIVVSFFPNVANLILQAVFILVLIGFFVTQKIYQNLGLFWLEESVDLKKYQTYIYETFGRSILHQNDHKLHLSYINFLQGEFRNALDLLDEIDLTKFKGKKGDSKKLFYWKVYGRASAFLQDNHFFEKAKIELNHLLTIPQAEREAVLNELDAIHSLVNLKKSNDFFEKQVTSSKLQFISKNYFRGLNATLEQRWTDAKIHFQDIYKENAELYYVQQAKIVLEGDV